jgi:drug/metabolite transporter (DMT)-like permease
MSAARPSPADWALFLFCVATWGSAYAAVRVALTHGATPWLIVALRLGLAAALLHAILHVQRRRGRAPPPTQGVQGKLILLGALGAAIPFALFSHAQLGASSGLVGLYSAVTPIVVAAIAPFFAQEERLTLARGLGVAMGFAGVAVLMGPSAFGAGPASLTAQLAAAAGAMCYAANTMVARAGKQIPVLEASAWWTFYGALMAAPMALLNAPAAMPAPEAFAAIAFLALFPTALAGVAYFALIRSTGPLFVSQTNYLLPLWALALGAAAFGEPIGPGAIVSFALIAAGLFVAQQGWRRPAAAS